MDSRTDLSRWTLRLSIVGAIPLLALLTLKVFNVPIGQPFFLVYHYSPLATLRAQTAAVGLLIGAIGVYFFWRGLRFVGAFPFYPALAVATAYIALAAWTLFAPPQFAAQHAFNLVSPSHDGAFVLEAREVVSIREYGSQTFFHRLQLSVEEMRGRRVISNPPGMTVAAVLTRRAVDACPPLSRLIVGLFDLSEIDDLQQRQEFAGAMLLAILMTAAWGASLIPAYKLARTWLSPGAAIVVAFGSVFNPATVCFTPGKDPAQLLTVMYAMFFWLRAYRQRRPLCAIAAGAILAMAAAIGLVHIWTFAIVAGATLLHALVTDYGIAQWIRRCAFPSLVGGIATCSLAYIALDWNIPLIIAKVAQRYAQIQVPIITDPFYWTLVGFPMFLLFIGPFFYAQVLAMREPFKDSTASLGGCILLVAAAVMAYTYFFGNNNETPRLWIPFIPFLILGLALRRKTFREDSPNHRHLWITLVAIQIAVTVVHWSLLDVRETEWRLTTGRMWN